jgi:Ca2+-binding RTX toxin-like protein
LKEASGFLSYMFGMSGGKKSSVLFGSTENEETESYVEGPEDIATGVWSHVALTFDGTKLRLFVNGSLVASEEAFGPIGGEGPLLIGANPSWGRAFNGKVDEVRIYNRALDTEEITVDKETPVEGTEGSEESGGCRPETEVWGEVTEREIPGVGLTVRAAPQETHCKVEKGEKEELEEARIKSIHVYIDGELAFSEERDCEVPEKECEYEMFRRIQLPYEQVIGTHNYRVEAEDQLGRKAEPLSWTKTTSAEGTIAGVSPEAEASGEKENCSKPENRHKEYVIRHGVLYGTPCADIIPVHAHVSVYYGRKGDDIIRGGGGVDKIKGGAGEDTLYGGRGGDHLFGGVGPDRVYGGTGDDFVHGGDGNDTLNGGPGRDFIGAGGGNDLVRGGATVDRLVGGEGTNTLSFADGVTPGFEADPESGSSNPATDLVEGFPGKTGERGVYVNLSGSPARIANNGAVARWGGGSDIIQADEFQNVIGTPFADLIVGSSAANVIDAGAGTDIVRGGGGNDEIYGGADSDYLDGGAEQASNSVHGGAGTDTCLNGGEEASCESSNPETAIEPASLGKIAVGLLEPDDSGFNYADLYLRGSELPDSVTATWSAEKVSFVAKGEGTGRFNPAESGASGCEITEATAECPISGADSIVMSGGPGRDVLKAHSFPTGMSVTILGGTDGDILEGGGSSEDALVDGPGTGADKLRGNGGDDGLFDNAGRDELVGGAGNDLFISSTVCDADTIRGGDGSDNANWAQLVGPEIEAENAEYPSWSQEVYEDPEHGVHAVLGDGGEEGTIDQEGKACEKKGKIFGVESLEGSQAADILVGNKDSNTLLGRSGADTLKGLGGNDHLLANNRHAGNADADNELDCGGGNEDVVKVDPKDPANVEGECEKVVHAKGAQYLIAGIGSESAVDDFSALDEASISGGSDSEAAGPLALYQLDESSGTTALNATQDEGESDGSYENGVSLEEPGAFEESRAVHLDGSNDFLDLTSNWDPNEFAVYESCFGPDYSGYSVEMWVKFDSGASGREELFSRSEGENGLFLYRSADGKLNLSVGDTVESPVTKTDQAVSDGEWHHVVGTLEYKVRRCATFPTGPDAIEAPRITLYVDGFANSLGIGNPFPPATPLADNLVGAKASEGGPTNFLSADIYDVAIYGEALSEEEVESHLADSEAPPPSTILLPPLETEDWDEDGVANEADNCPEVANPEQEDSDLDGVGDACQEEPDSDGDGIADEADNCPEVSNVEQIDSNENGIGDACEEEE